MLEGVEATGEEYLSGLRTVCRWRREIRWCWVFEYRILLKS